MYKILGTETEDEKVLIKTLDKRDGSKYLYYEEEVRYIPDAGLRKFLNRRLYFIVEGNYG